MTAQPSRECDMIMKGGVTSGVVYPLAATHLAETYRFRQLGGASAGAIAAVMVAAAELGRREGFDGFGELAKLPEVLGQQLATLFQPSAKARPAFRLLPAFVYRERSKPAKAMALLAAAIRSAPLVFVLGFVLTLIPGVAIAFGLSPTHTLPAVARVSLLWLPMAAVVAIVLALGRFLFVTMVAIERNAFGMCDGHTQTDAAHPPLTDWMTGAINRMAGRPEDSPPVTFGDLWGAEAVAAFDAAVPEGRRLLDLAPYRRRELAAARLLSLEVMTTNLTLRRPYRFPFEGREFFYCPRCFARYFPDGVLAAMVSHSAEVPDVQRPATATGEVRTISTLCVWHSDTRVRYFPRPPDVPIVVAARLSLSFPVLISAVPLFYIDYGRAPEHIAMIPVWFSDGGIANNFPMHLFDAPWPHRPTFGINLQPLDDVHGSQRVYLPKSTAARSHPIGSLFGFGAALLDTMQNWVDVTQLTLPSYRGRVAEIRLSEDEGGLNLDMPSPLVHTLAVLGAQVAELFDGFDLADHQRSRFETSMAAFDDLITGLSAAAAGGFDATVSSTPPGARAAAADQLIELGTQWTDGPAGAAHPGVRGDIPRPVGDLRLVPRQ